MDDALLIQSLPTDLLYLLIQYDPSSMHFIDMIRLIKFDWFYLIRLVFGLEYSREESSNLDIMKVYFRQCIKKKNEGILHYFEKLADGKFTCCGKNNYGQLGFGDNKSRGLFEEMKNVPKNIYEIACGTYFSIMRLTDGTLMSCGCNDVGQLGLGDNTDRNIFTEIKNIPKNISEIQVGERHVLILLTDGTLMSCGDNTFGQLGLGDYLNRNRFTEIKNITKNIAEIETTPICSIIFLTNGTIMGCGYPKELNQSDNIFIERKGIYKKS